MRLFLISSFIFILININKAISDVLPNDLFSSVEVVELQMSSLQTNSIKNNSVKNFLNKNEVKKNNSIFISFSSRFLFSKKIIKELFFDNLFNIHCSRLPNDKGGGGYSWRIMRNDRIGNLCIHKISNEEIDAGLIYKFHKFVIDRKLIIPEDIHRETNVKLIKFKFIK